MVMDSAAGIVAGQKFWNGGWAPADGYVNDAAYAGTNRYVWYPYILKFTAPEFTGVSTKAEITLYVGNGRGDSPPLRWALCDSDENKELYRDTNDVVKDSHQLAYGTVTMENVADKHYPTIEIKTTRIRSGGTYYLYLWGFTPPENPQWVTVYYADCHVVTIFSMAGAVRVKTPNGVKLCAVYNGRKIRMIPQVKTQTGIRPTG